MRKTYFAFLKIAALTSVSVVIAAAAGGTYLSDWTQVPPTGVSGGYIVPSWFSSLILKINSLQPKVKNCTCNGSVINSISSVDGSVTCLDSTKLKCN